MVRVESSKVGRKGVEEEGVGLEVDGRGRAADGGEAATMASDSSRSHAFVTWRA